MDVKLCVSLQMLDKYVIYISMLVHYMLCFTKEKCTCIIPDS